MRVLYVMLLFILTEARKVKKKKSESEAEPTVTVPPNERYYRVPFGAITLEGFNPLLKGPLEYEDFDFRYFKALQSTKKPDLVPFVPNNENDSKASRRKWKSKKEIKKKRDHGSKAFGMSRARTNDSPQTGDESSEGQDDNDKTQSNTPKVGDRAGIYLDLAKNFIISVGHRYKEGKSFAHGSLPDQASITDPEPTEIPHHVVEDKYYPERRIPGSQYTPYSYVPPHLRNSLVDDRNINWTTCEEFAKDAVFYPKDVIDIEWVPFFVWSITPAMIDSIIHTFEYPTIKLVQKYKKMASPLLKKKLDWEAPKLMMKMKTPGVNNDILIIAADRKGKFDGLKYMEIPEGVKDLKYAMPYPVLSLHLKLLGSYLAMMTCNDNYAVIMAPSGTEPKTFDAARRGAAFLKFSGTGYVVKRNLLREQMSLQNQRDMEARILAQQESQTMIPPGPRDAFFPFNRELPLDI